MTPMQLLTSQKTISTREFQSHFADAVKTARESGNYYNVVRNGESMGIFLPTELWDSLMEDFEALTSPKYLKAIEESYEDIKAGRLVSMEEAFKS